MRINITGRHLDVTAALKDYIEKKSEKVKYFFPHVMDVGVYLIHKKGTHKVEVNVISEGKTFFCEASSDDMYASIDSVFDKLDRQIKKYKEKLMNHKSVTSTALNFLQSRKSTDDAVRITKIKEMLPKPMTGHEIILRLSLYEHRFEIFKEDRERDYTAVALKFDNNLYSIIDRNNGSWMQKDYKLNGEQVELLDTKKTEIEELNQDEAIENLLSKNLDYIVYFDSELKVLNIVYVRKDHTLGLITSS
jgi:putative sigma-54 modulation protein